MAQKARIKDTGTVFDGKLGLIEKETDTEAILLVDFDADGHKVRNNFSKDNLEIMENETLLEDINDDFELEISEKPLDKKLCALADFLELDYGYVKKENINADPNESLYASCLYKVEFPEGYEDEYGEGTFLVCTDDEADILVREDAKSLIEDCGFEELGLDVSNYVRSDAFEDWIAADDEDYVYSFSYDDLITECLERNIISMADFELNDDVDVDDEDFDDEDISNYTCNYSEDELRQKFLDELRYEHTGIDSVEYVKDYYGSSFIEEQISAYRRTHSGDYPDYVDMEEAVDDFTAYQDRGQRLGSYNGDEYYLEGSNDSEYFYAYRVD